MSPHRQRLLALTVAALLVVFLMLIVATAHPQAPTCDREPHGHAIVVNLDNGKSPEAIRHEREAVASGSPRYLHWAPARAAANRAASLRGVATKAGFDRDEYPPAATAEGGAGADVRLIPAADNRSAGARIGAIMRPYCAGQAFILEP